MRRSRTALIVVAGIVAVLLVAALIAGQVLAGRPVPASSTPAAAAPSVPVAPVAWHRCTDTELETAGAQCGTVTAPLDWSAPGDGRTVRLAVSRVRHTAKPYQGVILANPGGPGGSGLSLATLGAEVPGGVGDRYDWIGFDPRGIGDSRPRLSCDADYANGPRPSYDPATAATIRAWRSRSDAYAKACGRRNGDLLAHMSTADAARDLDLIRRALRTDRISFYGFSYGTYLGQVYATLFPTRLRRMVLDSTVDPKRVWYGANLDQDAAFQTALEHWFDWIADHHGTYGLGTTRSQVESAYTRLGARLQADPAEGVFGEPELADTLLYAGYSQRLWPGLAGAFASAVRGDAQSATTYWRSLNETTDDNGYAGYLAVECTDAAWPSSWATWEADTRRVDAKAPFGTWLNTWFNAPCRTWPAKAGTPVGVDGGRVAPILMVGQTLDAATPFSGNLAVRRLFPRARLIAQPGGTSHAVSLSGDTCVDGAIAAYLADGTLPARKPGDGPDARCSPGAEPSP